MPEPKEKPKQPHIKERTPRKRTEEAFPYLRKPTADSIAEIIGLPISRTPPTPRTDATHPISPERDFTKVPNSVSRDVVPAGHFVGKSKQLYDCLFQRTRGAIVPTRRLAISKPDLMGVSGIGSERTLLKNLTHLKNIGLVRVTYTDGRHEGNTYEVFTPEEVGLRTPPTPPTPRHARAEVPPVPPVESGVRDVGSKPLESTISGEPKTSFKTRSESDDDEFPRLRAAAKEITGREARDWRELDELLSTELRIAAGRTTVSSVPAFLAEHLRRRLWKVDKGSPLLSRYPASGGALEAQGRASGGRAEQEIDASACPDCFGANFRYKDKDNMDLGVVRCRHGALSGESPE